VDFLNFVLCFWKANWNFVRPELNIAQHRHDHEPATPRVLEVDVIQSNGPGVIFSLLY
jgi:hypothetical protein